MLDLRIYRAAFLPALLVLVVCAFSLGDRPRASTTTLAPGAFDTLRAFGQGDPPGPRDSLLELAASFPDRRPGSLGDERLAQRVAEAFEATGLQVDVQRRQATTIDGDSELTTVVGTRPGLSSRRIVVVAHRDAAQPGSVAELSATASLLELARVFRAACPQGEEQCGRELRRTLVLVSTSGGTGGAGGVRNWLRRAQGTPIDAVLVLGDMAGQRIHKPWVPAWSNAERQPPLALRRTVEAAVRRETGQEPGGPRASAQWIRRAFPLAAGEQAELAAEGLPAVGLSVSGERAPAPDVEVVERRMEEFGRAALRAISAVDDAGTAPDGTARAPFEASASGIVTVKRVLPDWAVRLLAAALLLPAVLAAVDAAARVRRRRYRITPWLTWVALATLPFVAAVLWVRVFGLVALDVPPVPLIEANHPITSGGRALLATTALVLAGGALLVRSLSARVGDAAEPAGAAAALVLCALAVLVWAANPYAAGLLVPVVHVGLLLAAPEARLRGAGALAALAVALLPLAAVLLYYASALDVGPVGLAWVLGAAAAGGHFSLVAGLVAAGIAGALWRAVSLALRRPRHTKGPVDDGDFVTRGPLGYAGPGSLGGTESALRR